MNRSTAVNAKRAKIPKKRKIWIPVVVVIALAAAAIALFFLRPDLFENILPDPRTPEKEAVVIPWNPGGTADLVTRSLHNEAAPGMDVQNVNGANGASGLNEVYDAPHKGKLLLGTNLSSLVTLKQLGFTEAGYESWAIWLAAYSPSIIAVRSESSYRTLDELIAAAQITEIRCANAGNGTLSFVAAHLFADGAGIEVKHVPYSGSNPAINAVLNGEADFIVALSSELISKLRTGELRALASLYDDTVTFSDATEAIPPASNTIPELANTEPFGEYYGFMVPRDTPESVLKRHDRQWGAAAASDAFGTFAEDKGLIRLDSNRWQSAGIAERIASIICWTLYDTGCVNVSPETLNIPRTN